MTSAEIPTGMSETGYSNAEYDQMYKEQTSALDVESRKEIVWKMQKLVHDDVVYVIPFYAKAVQAYRTDRFTGWKTDQPKLAMEDPTSLMYVEPVK
jgi:peptide/nickel transport system substrate-binding protein